MSQLPGQHEVFQPGNTGQPLSLGKKSLDIWANRLQRLPSIPTTVGT
jgi:hypothetical protein